MVGRTDRASQASDVEIDLQVELTRPLDIVADKQVKVTVIVDIKESGRRTPVGGLTGRATGSRDIGKTSLPVLEQVILPQCRDVQIGPAIIVEIAGCDTHAVAADAESGLPGDIGKLSVAIVLVQCECGCGFLFMSRKPGGIHQQQVRVTVIVVIEECRPTPDSFRHELVTVGTVGMDKIDTRFTGDIPEDDRRRCLRQHILFDHRAGHDGFFNDDGGCLVTVQVPADARCDDPDSQHDGKGASKPVANKRLAGLCFVSMSLMFCHK